VGALGEHACGMTSTARKIVGAVLAVVSVLFGALGVFLLATGLALVSLVLCAAAALLAWAAFAVAPAQRGHRVSRPAARH
jgi:hypothetical protein